MHKYLQLALWIIAFLVISFGIGQATQNDIGGGIQSWYQALEKPSFNPPNIAFPIVWSILYVMIAIAGWNLWRVGAAKSLKIIFGGYMLMNWAWTPIFFGLHQITLGLVWIIALSVLNLVFIIKAWSPVRLSAVLMVPLLAWTSFASVLNYFIWALN